MNYLHSCIMLNKILSSENSEFYNLLLASVSIVVVCSIKLIMFT